MKTTLVHEMKLRKGSPEWDRGACILMLTLLVDDCQMSGKRRRSELADKLSHGELRHEDVALAV